jgi:hypothetical protein
MIADMLVLLIIHHEHAGYRLSSHILVLLATWLHIGNYLDKRPTCSTINY